MRLPRFDGVKTVFNLLTKSEKIKLYILFASMLVSALLDVVGVGSILPFFSIASDPEIIATNQYLHAVYSLLRFENHTSFLVFFGVIIILLLVFGNTFKALLSYYMVKYSKFRECRISTDLFDSYLSKPYSYFLYANSSDLSKNVLNEVGNLVGGILLPFLDIISKLLIIVLLLFLIILTDPFIALLVALSISTVYVTIYISIKKILHRLGGERVALSSIMHRNVLEAFGGIKDVKIYDSKNYFVDHYNRSFLKHAKNTALQDALSTIPKFTLESIAFGSLVIVFLVLIISNAGKIDQAIPIFSLYAFAGYRLMPNLQAVFQNVSKIKYFHNTLEIVSEGMHQGAEHQAALHDFSGFKNIRFESVGFAYAQAEKPTLKNISIAIKAHETIGIVGETGSGKTTFIDILMGLHEVYDGSISIDSVKLAGSNIHSWRKIIGYVPQSIFLSDSSIKSNIAFGIKQESIEMDKVVNAGRIAHIHDFILKEFKDGYDTVIGERGVRLSGGQRQRIGIARALYRDPEILVFDEATNALDNSTEKALMETIKEIQGHKTILMIAHRLSTIQSCSNILVFDDGVLIDQGTYKDLMDRCAKFQAMARLS